jgi:hypothetical protein
MFRIAIQPNLRYDRNAPYSDRWIERLTELGHDVQLVNVRADDFIERVSTCDGFLWWFPPGPLPRELGRRLLTALAQMPNLLAAPDWRSCWHFDDKIAQSYLLRAAGIPMPKTHVFWLYSDAVEFLRHAQYPLVLKLSYGYRARNVGLLRNRLEAEAMARRLFGAGVVTLEPRRFDTLRAMVRSIRSWIGMRLGRAPLPKASRQQSSMLVQEFVPGNEFDTRVTIIGDRAFAWRRGNRPNDFRASGGGRNDTNPANIESDVVRLAFHVAQTLQMPSMSTDVLRLDGRPVITEVSYYYEQPLIHACAGHWRLHGNDLEWIEGPIRAEDAILDDFLSRLTSFRNNS